METIQINRFQFPKNSRLGLGSTESDLYRIDDKVYKVIKDKYTYKKELVIEDLHEDPIIDTITPDKKLYDYKIKDFAGYTMPYLKGFVTLDKYLNGNISYEQYNFQHRRELCLRLITAIDELNTRGYIPWDIHGQNIMYNGKDLCMIDIDSAINRRLGITMQDTCLSKQINDWDAENVMIGNAAKEIICILLNIGAKDDKIYWLTQNYKKYGIFYDFIEDKIFDYVRTHSCDLFDIFTYFTDEVISDIFTQMQNDEINEENRSLCLEPQYWGGGK